MSILAVMYTCYCPIGKVGRSLTDPPVRLAKYAGFGTGPPLKKAPSAREGGIGPSLGGEPVARLTVEPGGPSILTTVSVLAIIFKLELDPALQIQLLRPRRGKIMITL